MLSLRFLSLFTCLLAGWAPKCGPRKVNPEGWAKNPRKVGRWGDGWGPKGGAPKGGRPKISRFFSSPATFLIFSPLSGGLLVEFLVVFEAPQMCTFGVLGLSCETPAAQKPPGFHTTAREPQLHAHKDVNQLADELHLWLSSSSRL